jgi:hypothetical protein
VLDPRVVHEDVGRELEARERLDVAQVDGPRVPSDGGRDRRRALPVEVRDRDVSSLGGERAGDDRCRFSGTC